MTERPDGPDLPNRRRSQALKIIFGVLILILLGALLANWEMTRPVLEQANWVMVMPALVFTFVSVGCASASYVVINRTFGLPTSNRTLMTVGFVNMALNNLITLFGAAGTSVSALLLKGKDTSVHDVVSAATFNFYLHFLIGTIVLPPSLLYLMFNHSLPAAVHAGVILVILISTVVAIAAVLLVLVGPIRAGILRLLGRLLRVFTRRELSPALAEFDESLARGLALLRVKRAHLTWLLTFHLATWLFCLVALWFCFAAFGSVPPLGILVSGYFVALDAGAISMIPGGLGVQDGSMAAIFVLLGTPREATILASILYRFVYYLIPFGCGLAVYGLVMRQAGRSTT